MKNRLFLQNPTLLKAITVMNQTLEGYTLRFWKNIFRPKYIDLVRSVQSCCVYRYVATSAKDFSVANTSMDSVVNVTLNLARRSNTILNRMRMIFEAVFERAYFGTDFAAIRRNKFAARYFWFKAKLKQKKFIFK